MPDTSTVTTTAPRWMEVAFEATARGLRAIGRRRYAIADAAGMITYLLQPPRKRRLCAHLHSRAAGGLPAAEARRRARASYRNYSRMIIDTIWIHAIGLDEMFEYGHIVGVENLHKTRDAGRGGILVLAHFGSWDIAASMALAAGHPVTTVMAPVGTPSITALLAWSRKVKQMELFAPEAAARGLIRALRQGRWVAILTDIPEGGPTTEVRFCNGPVQFSTGPASLARLTGSPLVPISCWRSDAGYHVHVREPFHANRDDDEQVITQRIATVLEPDLLRVPEQWYPFNPIYTDEA
ncbi:MAG: lysophospholipid acyltransferase family protein [Candidatus Dormibacteraeota bacterium]|uniref:Lysophospholipid acyltransferase family protein n=1 Tax=Candidatus Aeolococcus gillhamiae TaxID=3127015 RepID=A0A934JXR8_9BACT|nr:lysophospholipid acyltransferase family protein [Candidatus Dormibacteraeota bacterium]